jgi:cytochrome b
MTAGTDAEGAEDVRGPAWDPVVRIVHWGVAAAIVLNGLLTEGGETLHVWIGWAAVAMLALRLLWGLIGPEEARFSAFPPSLSAAREHIDDIRAGRRRPTRSHNPLGALMVYALWGMLAVTTATGIAMEGAPFPETASLGVTGTQADEHGGAEREDHDEREEDENEVLEEVHEAAANILLILAALHVAGVAFESRRFGVDLVRPMIDGRRREP